tara:strand:- start:783 stop:1319 length:537 start_codon:yes stop_codon:yes gene_type:complete
MRCYVGLEVGQEFNEFYRNLIVDVSERFGLERLREKERIPHVTLKSPFEVESLEEVNEVIDGFCSKVEKSWFGVYTFGDFEEEIIYLEATPWEGVYRSVDNLLRGLKKVRDISFGEYDSADKIYHVTVANGDELEGRFNEVMDHVSGLNLDYVIPFDHVSIFEKMNGKSKVVRRFKID